jgi:hypothetical protein
MKSFLKILPLLFLIGCTTVKGPISGKSYTVVDGQVVNMPAYAKELKEVYLLTHPNDKPEHLDAIKDSALILGMNKEQVKASLGLPDEEVETIFQNAVVDLWEYSLYHSVHAYFKNDTLVIVQNLPQ